MNAKVTSMSETTQNYKKDSSKRNIHKEILCEFLDFIKFKVETDRLTADEVTSLVESVVAGTNLYSTAKELARFYNQSEHNVRCVINRRLIAKPQRRVYYPFSAFAKVVPQSWKECRNK